MGDSSLGVNLAVPVPLCNGTGTAKLTPKELSPCPECNWYPATYKRKTKEHYIVTYDDKPHYQSESWVRSIRHNQRSSDFVKAGNVRLVSDPTLATRLDLAHLYHNNKNGFVAERGVWVTGSESGIPCPKKCIFSK